MSSATIKSQQSALEQSLPSIELLAYAAWFVIVLASVGHAFKTQIIPESLLRLDAAGLTDGMFGYKMDNTFIDWNLYLSMFAPMLALLALHLLISRLTMRYCNAQVHSLLSAIFTLFVSCQVLSARCTLLYLCLHLICITTASLLGHLAVWLSIGLAFWQFSGAAFGDNHQLRSALQLDSRGAHLYYPVTGYLSGTRAHRPGAPGLCTVHPWPAVPPGIPAVLRLAGVVRQPGGSPAATLARLHLWRGLSYREMWRLFDRGLFAIVRDHVYIPLGAAGSVWAASCSPPQPPSASSAFIMATMTQCRSGYCSIWGSSALNCWLSDSTELRSGNLAPMAQPGVSPPSGGGFRGGKSHSAFDGDFLFILRHPNWVAGDEGDAVAAADGTKKLLSRQLLGQLSCHDNSPLPGLSAGIISVSSSRGRSSSDEAPASPAGSSASRPPRSGSWHSRNCRVFSTSTSVDDDLAERQRGLQQDAIGVDVGLAEDAAAALLDSGYTCRGDDGRPTQRLKVLGHLRVWRITDGLVTSTMLPECSCTPVGNRGRGQDDVSVVLHSRRCGMTSMLQQAEEAKPPAAPPKPDSSPGHRHGCVVK
uniref:HTTM domain-containing protein n=1 Tax=Macrostomum lignano TaxID=282301 RepID=A0A1I8FKF4_9PLAT